MGDYNKYRRHYEDISGDQDVVAANAGPFTLKTVRNSSYTLYIQRVVVSITTFSAKTWTLQDSSGTPVPIGVASIPAAEGTAADQQAYVFDFGPVGTALTAAKNLVLALSGAGAAGRVHWEGYSKLTGVLNIGDGANT